MEASRRATGTDPHSHTGNATPAAAAAGSWSGPGSRPSFSNADDGTKTSMAAETAAPSRMKGIASTSSDENTMSRFWSQAIRAGSITRTRTATPARASRTIRARAPADRGPRGEGPRRRDLDGHQQYLANATANDGYTCENCG